MATRTITPVTAKGYEMLSAVGTVAAVMLARGTLARRVSSRQGVTVPEPRYGKRDGA